MVCVIFASQARSLAISVTSAVEKNLIPFCGGFPSGFSRRDAIRIGTSCGWQPSTQAACSTVSRAGGCPTKPEIVLLFFHAPPPLPKPKPVTPALAANHHDQIRYIGFLQGALAGDRGAGAARPPPGPRPRNPIVTLTHATVTFAFYRHHPMADCRRCFCPTVGDMPLLSRNSYHARRCRGGLIANPTLPSN